MQKELADHTFDDLVGEAHRSVFDALLTGGASAAKSKLHLYMCTAIRWREEVSKKEKAQKTKK